MKSFKALTGIVLAGGKSSRMGRDKGLLPLQGKAMVAHVLSRLLPCVDELLLVANEPAYQQFGCKVLPDLVKEAGPVGGIFTGLKNTGTPWAFVLSCDMPFISTAAIQYLLEHAGTADICVGSLKGRMQPLFGLYSTACLHLFEEHLQEGHYKLQALVRQAKYQEIPLDSLTQAQPHLLQNINTPEEFSQAIKLSSSLWK